MEFQFYSENVIKLMAFCGRSKYSCKSKWLDNKFHLQRSEEKKNWKIDFNAHLTKIIILSLNNIMEGGWFLFFYTHFTQEGKEGKKVNILPLLHNQFYLLLRSLARSSLWDHVPLVIQFWNADERMPTRERERRKVHLLVSKNQWST